jgi:hypothetical protein
VLKASTLRGCSHFLRKFQHWAETEREPITKVRLETLLLDYMDILLQENQAVYNIEKTIAAAVASTLGASRGDMKRLNRALTGYRKAIPPRSRLPIPDELCAALAAVLMADKHPETAIMTVLGQDGYFRPGEMRDLCVSDLVAPPGGLDPVTKYWSLIVAPEERLEASKTQTFDDTVVLDSRPWLGQLLHKQCSGKLAHNLIFNIKAEEMVAQWKQACSVLRLQVLVMYQLRHGGASSDMLSRKRGAADVMLRGRWRSLSSLRRYAKPGQLAKLLNNMSPEVRKFSQQAHRRLQDIMEGTFVLRKPK